MGAPWHDHPAWKRRRAGRGRARRAARTARARRARRDARPHPRRAARGAPHLARRLGSRARPRSTHPSRSPATRSARSPRSIAAGALSLDDGVRFAARRAELTQAAADAHPGRMAALLGATVEQAEDACAAAPDACWVANDNAPGQVVIAGTPDGVDAGSARAKELGVKRATPLNVGGAFHTPLMRDAADALADELDDDRTRAHRRRRSSRTTTPRRTPTRDGWRARLGRARDRPGALARVDGDARRSRRRRSSSRSATAR